MNDLERKEALQRELDKREAAKSTSERQADYLTRRGRSADLVDLHVVIERGERERTYGDDSERPELDGGRASATSRRQAARLTRGASSRDGDE